LKLNSHAWGEMHGGWPPPSARAAQADFHYARGAVPAAFKGYVRSRDYCTSPRQVVDMCLAVIRCAVENGGFVHVSNYVSKARACGRDRVFQSL